MQLVSQAMFGVKSETKYGEEVDTRDTIVSYYAAGYLIILAMQFFARK